MAYSGVSNNGPAGGVALPQALLDVYSLDIMHEAQGIMRFRDFAVHKTDLLKQKGETVHFTKYKDITRGGRLTEGDPITTRNMTASQVGITVDEFGNGIKVSEKLVQLSYDDVLAEAAVLLGRDYALVNDLEARDTLVTGAGSTLFTTPTALTLGDVLAADTMDIEIIRNAVEELQGVNAPKFDDDYYVCFVHTHQVAHIKRDPDWIAAQHYAGSRNLFRGELGRWEDVVFVASTHVQNGAAASTEPGYDATLDGTGHDGQDLYRAVILADQAYGYAEALPVELRDGGIEDFGRQHKLAWYSIMGYGMLEPSFALALVSS